MSDQQNTQTQGMTIQLEVVPDDEEQEDIADTDEVRQSLVDELRSSGYTVNPAYTGKKTGTAFDILLQIPQYIHDNREVLLAMFDSIAVAFQCLMRVSEKRPEREKGQRAPLEFKLEVNGKTVTITAPDAESGMKILQKLQSAYPEEAKNLTPRSNIKIKAKVPKKKRRHSH